MKSYIFVAAVLVLVALSYAGQIDIQYDQFSSSPTLSRAQGTSKDPRDRNYGAALILEDLVPLYTSTMCGGGETMTMTRISPARPKGCNTYKTVRRSKDCDGPAGERPNPFNGPYPIILDASVLQVLGLSLSYALA